MCGNDCINSWRDWAVSRKTFKYIKPFINEHNWEGIKYQSGKDDWEQFGKNNFNIAFNVLYEKEMKIWLAYNSINNSAC